MVLKSQSAVEILTLYSFVFVIIIVTVTVIYLLATAPKILLGYSQCGVFGGFSCPDSGYSINWTGGGSTIYLLILDEQPGVTNITSFNVSMLGVDSGWNENGFDGSCNPSILTQGELAYCTAIFSYTPSLGHSYRGEFSLDGHYCPQSLINTNVPASCPLLNETLTYKGYIDAEATRVLPVFSPTTIPTSLTTTSTVMTTIYACPGSVHVGPGSFGITGDDCLGYNVVISSNGIYVNYQHACPSDVQVTAGSTYYDNTTGCYPTVHLSAGGTYYNLETAPGNAIIPTTCGDLVMAASSLAITGGYCTGYSVKMSSSAIYVNYQHACPATVKIGNSGTYYNNVTGCSPSVQIGNGAHYYNING